MGQVDEEIKINHKVEERLIPRKNGNQGIYLDTFRTVMITSRLAAIDYRVKMEGNEQSQYCKNKKQVLSKHRQDRFFYSGQYGHKMGFLAQTDLGQNMTILQLKFLLVSQS